MNAGTGSPRRAGRPRRLTTNQVIEAAIALGLDDLTMAALAKSLGVRVAVLYNYVKNREELISLAARHAMADQRFPIDEGQDWRAYARAYARAAYGLFRSDAQLLPLLIAGKISPAAKLDSAEGWLAVMTSRGFCADRALRLLRAVDAIIMGSALLASHARAHAADYPRTVRGTILARPRSDLPLLSTHAEMLAATADPDNWETSLDMLLDGIEPHAGHATDT
ncbi:AcrR family transcriptional regulator [Sphingobium sp. OAS761]|nr:AcrR family transcriptional regulator [Sphingobium sp. OAS761]